MFFKNQLPKKIILFLSVFFSAYANQKTKQENINIQTEQTGKLSIKAKSIDRNAKNLFEIIHKTQKNNQIKQPSKESIREKIIEIKTRNLFNIIYKTKKNYLSNASFKEADFYENLKNKKLKIIEEITKIQEINLTKNYLSLTYSNIKKTLEFSSRFSLFFTKEAKKKVTFFQKKIERKDNFFIKFLTFLSCFFCFFCLVLILLTFLAFFRFPFFFYFRDKTYIKHYFSFLEKTIMRISGTLLFNFRDETENKKIIFQVILFSFFICLFFILNRVFLFFLTYIIIQKSKTAKSLKNIFLNFLIIFFIIFCVENLDSKFKILQLCFLDQNSYTFYQSKEKQKLLIFLIILNIYFFLFLRASKNCLSCIKKELAKKNNFFLKIFKKILFFFYILSIINIYFHIAVFLIFGFFQKYNNNELI